jgi:hypothetical protein
MKGSMSSRLELRADNTVRSVGATKIEFEVANPARPSRSARRKMLADSGAAYAIVARPTLQRIGIRLTRTFLLDAGRAT